MAQRGIPRWFIVLEAVLLVAALAWIALQERPPVAPTNLPLNRLLPHLKADVPHAPRVGRSVQPEGRTIDKGRTTPGVVDLRGDGFQMRRIHTPASVTQMVDLVPEWNRPNKPMMRDPVRGVPAKGAVIEARWPVPQPTATLTLDLNLAEELRQQITAQNQRLKRLFHGVIVTRTDS